MFTLNTNYCIIITFIQRASTFAGVSSPPKVVKSINPITFFNQATLASLLSALTLARTERTFSFIVD